MVKPFCIERQELRHESLLMREIFGGEVVDISGVSINELISRWISRNIPDGEEITALRNLRGIEFYNLINTVKELMPRCIMAQRKAKLPIEFTKAENTEKLHTIGEEREALRDDNGKLRAQILAAKQKLAQRESDIAKQVLQKQQEAENREKEKLAKARELLSLKKTQQGLSAAAARIKSEIQPLSQRLTEIITTEKERTGRLATLSTQEKENEQTINGLARQIQVLSQEKVRLEKLLAEARDKQSKDKGNMTELTQSFEQLQKAFSVATEALSRPNASVGTIQLPSSVNGNASTVTLGFSAGSQSQSQGLNAIGLSPGGSDTSPSPARYSQ